MIRNPTESVERRVLHILDHTLIALRFDLATDKYTVLLKKGEFSTFGDFFKDTTPVLFEAVVDSLEDVVKVGTEALKTLTPAQVLEGDDDLLA